MEFLTLPIRRKTSQPIVARPPKTIVSGRRNEVAGGLHGAPVAHLPKHPAGTCCAETVGVTF